MSKPYLLSLHTDKDSLVASWRDIHAIIAAKNQDATTIADLLGYAIYYYSVHKTFGHEADIVRSRNLLEQLLLRLASTSRPVWSTTLLDQVVALAWLHAELAHSAAAEAVSHELAQLDAELLAEAGTLQARARAEGRPKFLRIALYFYLRRTSGLSPAYWVQIMGMLAVLVDEKKTDFWFPYLTAYDVPSPLDRSAELGLINGLAGELLLLIQLYKADSQLAGIKEHVRQGVLYILSTKREVDFSEQKYSIFPGHVAGPQQEATFDNELSWSRGDLGQSLLLYNGYELLQDTELIRLAELVGLNTLLRTDVRSTAVTNSRFSSGAAGVAHLYHKLFLISGHDAYRKGYGFWLAQTRSWLPHELQNDFYRHREGDLLHGLVGVGLVLLSAISEKELRWDQFLL